MIKTLREVQIQTDEAIGAAQELVSEAELWLDSAQDAYVRRDRYMDVILGDCDSASFIEQLRSLAIARKDIDNRMNLLKIAIAEAKAVRIQCAIDLDAAYARRDETALQGALWRNWLTA